MITAIGMCKDEADIIRYTLAHLEAQGVDRFIVLDNGSTDGTREILEQFSCEIVDDPEPGYYQDRKMTELASRVTGGWVLPFDADELWYSPSGRTIAERLADYDRLTPKGQPDRVVAAVEYKHWPTPWDMPGDPNPFTRLVWREEVPHHLHKVAFRAHPAAFLHMGNHHVSFYSYNPDRPEPAVPIFELRHFPYRSFGQFARKVRQGRQAYEAATTCDATTVAGHRMTGTHWKEMGALDDQELAELWSDATAGFACSSKWLAHGDLIKDPAPWG